MRDPEFISLRNRFLIGVLVSVVFAVPLIFFIYKSYANSDVLTLLNNKETFTILVTSNKCENCELVSDILDDYDIDYKELNSDRNKEYQEIMKKLGIENKREVYPILVYVEDGSMKANLFDITGKEMIGDFLEFHKISN